MPREAARRGRAERHDRDQAPRDAKGDAAPRMSAGCRRPQLMEDGMKNIVSLAIVAFLSLLASCTMNPHPMDMTQAVQNAKTRSDHEALARHYEDVARDMQAKADDHKKMLAQYERNRSLYGKQGQSLIGHCQDLAHIYEQAAAENRSMAESHHQMAADAK